MHRGLARFILRRAAFAAVLVLVVTSTSLLLVRLAPGDHFASFDLDPAAAAAERRRLGLDRPWLEQYVTWLGRAARFDLGESLRYRRPVADLVVERAQNTALLGIAALLLATAIGLPAGIITGSRDGPVTSLVRAASLVLVSVPPLVTSLTLLLLAALTGWFPVGGLGAASSGTGIAGVFTTAKYLVLPAIALALPIAASLERLQSQATRDALGEPSVRAALARGCSRRRIVWRHALRLSLTPVLAVYGLIVGALLGGSFAVEVVMAWPGLGALMYEALVARDLYLVAGCAAAGAAFLALGILASDIALAIADPRVEEPA